MSTAPAFAPEIMKIHENPWFSLIFIAFERFFGISLYDGANVGAVLIEKHFFLKRFSFSFFFCQMKNTFPGSFGTPRNR